MEMPPFLGEVTTRWAEGDITFHYFHSFVNIFCPCFSQHLLSTYHESNSLPDTRMKQNEKGLVSTFREHIVLDRAQTWSQFLYPTK